MLTREDILKRAEIINIKEVTINDQGDVVYVKEMSGADRDAFEQLLVKQIGTGTDVKFQNAFDNFRGKLCVLTVCDEKGKLLFKPSEYLLFSQSLKAPEIDKIVKASQELNKISEEKLGESVKN